MTTPLPRIPRLLGTVRTTALEAAVLTGRLALYSTGLLAERPAPHPPVDLPGPRPVVLVHGFVDNRSVFTLLRRSLTRHGWHRVTCVNYSPLTWDVRSAAAALGEHVADVCERTGQPAVDVVGHSLGGLIARYYVQRLGGDAHVHTLVSLGTPHAGTRAVPALSVHPLVRQMRPGSGLLTELAGPAPGCRTRFVSFWSEDDQVMAPVETARLDHPDLRRRSVRVRGVGHLAMPVHSAVIAQIRRELVGADDAEPVGAPAVEVA
ncbi:alpha/beta fold hydrolase [Streptomyces sp. TRM 70351]|uniref:esterase/lipase family protein n=1 Tax=Streptomyces sp. TRM 70351 TaxID=3116552 RepID=UPI002E7B1056|nr:alpha/beta fold hydrolase [Streptomyces sp. TRM 70351]MEE1927982.1 alpha/beta fold hydrolase [Streptomyces sp. TRM 70351]